MPTPFFSIIIPTYNSEFSLPTTIQSIINQEFVDWELIIVDDGSQDGTQKFLNVYSKDLRIKYIRQENMGVTAARNNGVKISTGEFITFLDSDDEVTPNWLGDFKKLIDNLDKAGYVSCGLKRNGKKVLPKLDKKISPYKYSSLAGSFALKKNIFEKIGGYDTVLKQSENWEMTARALDYCINNGYSIEHTENLNFRYDNYPSTAQTLTRDEYRAQATYYLYRKYKDGGVLHFRKDDFLLSSAINYTRAKKIKKSRKIFYENFRKNPSINNFVKILIFEIPPLRRRKWMRKDK